jgi:hypothetical protein
MPGGNQLMPMDCLPPVNASERLAKELNLLEVEIKKKSNELKTKNKIDCRNILSRIQILPNIEPIKNYSQYINGGDYVDRGRQSETVINMFAYLHRQCIDNNISPPKLVLGNHEVFYMTNDLDLAIFNGANHTFSPKSYAGSVFAPEVTIKKLQAKSEIIRGGIKDAMFTLACNVGTTIFSHAAISNIALIDLETYLREFQPQIEKSKMKTEKKNYFRVTSKELIECFQNINEKIVKYYAERKEPLSEADITSVVKALNRFNIMEMHLIEERATMTDLEQDLEQSISNLIDIMKGSESDNRHVGKITWQRKFGTSIDNLLPGATNVLGHDASPSHENMMPDPEFDCRVIYGDACRSNGYGTTANRITDDIGGTALISKVVSAIFRKGFNSNDENTQFNVKKIGVYSHEMREDILEIKARTNYQKLSLENETKTENSLPINSVLSEDDKMVIVYGKEFSLDKIEYENNHSSNLLPQLTVVREINANGKAGMYKINYSTTSSDAANKAGMGECRYCDGNKYAGEFFGTDRDGYGICTYPDGSVNFGAWSKNRENGYGILIDTNDDIRLAHWENGTLKTQKKIYNVNNIIKYAEKSENISPELKKEVNILKPTVYMDGRIALGSRIDANGKKYGLTVNKNGDIRIGEYGDKVIIDDEESKPVDHITVDLENKQKRVSKKVSEKTLLEVNKILDNKVWNQKFANKPMEMKEKLQPKSKVANKLQKFSGLKEFDDKKTSVTLEDLM